MEKFELIVPCHFGLEAVMRREIEGLGYEAGQVEDGRVTFWGDAAAVCRANVFLRTTERVLLKVGSFRAETFEELFQGTRAIPWEQYQGFEGQNQALSLLPALYFLFWLAHEKVCHRLLSHHTIPATKT